MKQKIDSLLFEQCFFSVVAFASNIFTFACASLLANVMIVIYLDYQIKYSKIYTISTKSDNCGIRHVTVPIATRILIANVRHIGLSNICVINLVYFKMQV